GLPPWHVRSPNADADAGGKPQRSCTGSTPILTSTGAASVGRCRREAQNWVQRLGLSAERESRVVRDGKKAGAKPMAAPAKAAGGKPATGRLSQAGLRSARRASGRTRLLTTN